MATIYTMPTSTATEQLKPVANIGERSGTRTVSGPVKRSIVHMFFSLRCGVKKIQSVYRLLRISVSDVEDVIREEYFDAIARANARANVNARLMWRAA